MSRDPNIDDPVVRGPLSTATEYLQHEWAMTLSYVTQLFVENWQLQLNARNTARQNQSFNVPYW